MSLEDVLKENNELLKEQIELTKQVLGLAANTGGTTSSATTSSAGTSDGDEEEKVRAEYEKLFGKKPRANMKIENVQAAIDKKKAGGDDDDDDGDDHISFAALKKLVIDWLGEFAKQEDKDNPDGTHPEVTARREALSTVLKSEKILNSGSGKLADLDGDDMGEKRDMIANWIKTKAMKVDKGHGIGRLAPDPEPTASDDDGLGI